MTKILKSAFLALLFAVSSTTHAFNSGSNYNTVNMSYAAGQTISQNIVFDNTMKGGGTFDFTVNAHNGGGRPNEFDTGNIKLEFYNSSNALVTSAATNFSNNLAQMNAWSSGPGDNTAPWSTLTLSTTLTAAQAASVAYVKITMIGTDGSWWAGDYGPEWQMPTLTFNGGSVNILYNPEFGVAPGNVQAQGWTASAGYSASCGVTSGSSVCVTNAAGVTANMSGGGYSATGGSTSGQPGGYTSTLTAATILSTVNNGGVAPSGGGNSGPVSVTNAAGSTATNPAGTTTLDVTNAGTYTNNGTNGTVTNTGTFTNNGTTDTVTNSGNFTNSSGATTAAVTNQTGGTFNNSGTTGAVTNTGTFTNNSGGTTGAVTNNSGGTFTNSGTTGNVTNAGTFTNNSGGVTGTVNNSGTFTNAGTVTTVTNTGTFTNTGTTGAVTNTSGTFNNNAGGTTGTVNNSATFNNRGTVTTVTNSGTFTNYSTGITGTITNSGTLTNSGRTGTVTNTGTVNNTGTAGNITNNATGTFNNNVGGVIGTVTNALNATLNNRGTVTTVTNTGQFTNYSTGTAGAVTNTGTISNAGTVASLVNTGTATNTGAISGTVTNNSGTFTNSGTTGNWTNSSTITNSGTMGNGTNNANASFTNNSGGQVGDITNNGTLVNNSGATIGAINNTATGTVSNNGTAGTVTNANIMANYGTTGDVTNTSAYAESGTAGNVNNSGIWAAVVGSTVGNITNTGAAGTNGQAGTINNSGVFGVGSTGVVGAVTNSGTFANDGTTGAVANTGTFITTGTTGVITNSGTVNFNGGSAAGIVNSGILDLRGGTNTPQIGNYSQNAAGTTIINFGQVATAGTATLDGTFKIYNAPSAYGKYNVLTATTLTGDYSSLVLQGSTANASLRHAGNNLQLFIMPDLTATQNSLDLLAKNIGNVNSLQASLITGSLNNDATLFGATGSSVSLNYGMSKIASGDLNTAGIVVGKKINDNWHTSLFLDKPFNKPTLGAVTPSFGLGGGGLIGWNMNKDQTGLAVSVSAAQNNGTAVTTRTSPEVSTGKMSLDGNALQVKVSYAKPINDWTLVPYAGIRKTTIKTSGYTEVGPEFPLTVGSTETKTTDAFAGLSVSRKITDKLSASVSLGAVKNVSYATSGLTASSDMGTLASPITGEHYFSLSAGSGFTYETVKNQRLGVNFGYQQRDLFHTKVTGIGINYTIGF